MARKENDLNVCGITQQIKPEFWEWSDTEKAALQAAENGDAGPMLEVLAARLTGAGMLVISLYGIVHDRDTVEGWNETEMRMVEELKEKHAHFLVKFAPGKGGTVDAIAKAVGVEPQYIEKARRGKYGYDNMAAYLIHAKDPDKFQYAPEDVAGLPGDKSYKALYMEKRTEWEKGRAAKAKDAADADIDWLEAEILAGRVTRSQIMLTDRLYACYARNKRRCDDAFDTYAQYRAYKTIQALEDGDFRLTVFFITGAAGAGKTRFAKRFVNAVADLSASNGGERWRICQTAASNPLDDYAGEEILLMDDVRGGALGASDWLKLLDPYNISPGSARYKNKIPACRCIVITSSKEPLEFFYYTRQIGGDRSEALDQFIRRIQSTVRVIRADDWSAPEFRIADTVQRAQPYELPVPGSMDLRTGREAMVTLRYGFDEDKSMTEDEAIVYLAEKVEANNGLLDKAEYQRRTDEAAEAAAECPDGE